MASVTVTISIEDLAGPTALDGVLVQVYDAAGITFITQGVTGSPFAAGTVDVTLLGDPPGISYVIRMSLNGWFFPGGSSQTILVTDPPIPPNLFGPFGSQQGATSQVATLVVKDDSMVPQPIEGVTLFVYDASDVFVTELTTDVLGEAELALVGSVSPGTTYIVRLRKPGVIFAETAQTIAVQDPLVPPATNVFDFTGALFVPPQSNDADMCMVYGTFTNVSLVPAKRLRLEFKPCPTFPTVGQGVVRKSSRLIAAFHSDPTLVRENILGRSVKVDTDKNGFFQALLPRNGFFEVHIQGLEDPIEITERIFIPDAASARAIDLFYPVVLSVTYDTDPVNVAEGETETLGFTITMSNTEIITDLDAINDLLTFSTDDDAIASVVLSSEDELTVQGLSVGSTTVEVERIDDLVVPSRPPLPALIVTPPVVNVT